MTIGVKPTGRLMEAGDVLLRAAFDYWTEFQKAGMHGAVTWLQGDDGSLVVFTRGEYAGDLKELVSSFGNVPEVSK